MPYETSGVRSLGTGVVTVDARDACVVGASQWMSRSRGFSSDAGSVGSIGAGSLVGVRGSIGVGTPV